MRVLSNNISAYLGPVMDMTALSKTSKFKTKQLLTEAKSMVDDKLLESLEAYR
jgi:hypothetical protein